MEAIDIRVGGDDDPLVAQVAQIFLDAQRHHHIIKLLVLID